MKKILTIIIFTISLGTFADQTNLVFCSYEGENITDNQLKRITMKGVMCMHSNSNQQQCQQPMRPQVPSDEYEVKNKIKYLSPGENTVYDNTLYICGSSNITYIMVLMDSYQNDYEINCHSSKDYCSGTITISANEQREVLYKNPLNLSLDQIYQLDGKIIMRDMNPSELELFHFNQGSF